MIKINFTVQFKCYIIGPTKESLMLKTSFEMDNSLVTVELSPDEDKFVELDKDGKEDRFVVEIENLKYSISPSRNAAINDIDYKTLPGNGESQEVLFKFCINAINRTFQAIRNFGIVPHVQLFNPDLSAAETYMSLWGLKYIDQEGEHQIFESFMLFALALQRKLPFGTNIQNIPEINASSWPDIEEALQDFSDPPPEKEFFTNAIEFLRLRNFRMALLESIICLEIVLTQYLRLFLKNRKGIQEDRINLFLKPDVGLTAKVAVMLDITIEKDELSSFKIDEVLKAIRWRNKIIHTTGRLPAEIGEQNLRDGITNTLALSLILANKKRQIESEPHLQVIAKSISENYKIPMPNIVLIARHVYSISINYVFHEISEKDVLEKVSLELIIKLKEYDSRIIENRHIFIRFQRFPNEVFARWRHGNLELIKQAPQISQEKIK